MRFAADQGDKATAVLQVRIAALEEDPFEEV